MFSTCLFCHASLGANQSIEHFPVGKRLAFDSERGRLWAVCPKCERWNLTPLEERWEALEECERAYRDTRKRVSTDNIALARLRDGTDLIRIGQPLRPEFAAWRYERVIAKRRWNTYRSVALVVGASIAYTAPVILGPNLGLTLPMTIGAVATGLGGQLGFNYWFRYEQYWRRHMRIEIDNGQLVALTKPQLHSAKWSLDEDDQLRLALSYGGHRRGLRHALVEEQRAELTGEVAQAAMRRVIVGVNHEGGSRDDVQAAVKVVETAIGQSTRTSSDNDERQEHPLRAYMNMFYDDHQKRRQPVVETLLGGMDARFRLALEMTLHEDDERRAMAGELGALYARWEEAERIAKISDGELTSLASSVNQSIVGAQSERPRQVAE